MGRMTFGLGLSEDRDTAMIEMREDGKTLSHIYLDAASLEAHIRDLAKLRSKMADEVTPELEIGNRIDVDLLSETSPRGIVPIGRTDPTYFLGG